MESTTRLQLLRWQTARPGRRAFWDPRFCLAGHYVVRFSLPFWLVCSGERYLFARPGVVCSLVLAWYAPRGYPRFGALILGGILSIAAGLIAFFLPGITALGLLIMIAAWAIVIGLIEIFAAVQLRR